ncbi:MAG: hypothetical protein GEU94_14360 [Micromonosporaceae bacterium]|nr:hypothetical protein [Micromonosporaceae bacterium]
MSDIEVLTRIADGLEMPDEARVLLGLAPADTRVTAIRGVRPTTTPEPVAVTGAAGGFGPNSAQTRLAICGSRAGTTNNRMIDAAVPVLARLVFTHRYPVSHGPVGVGIEVMTYIADHYRPPDFTVAVGLFGRRNVVRDAHYVLVIGGGAGTQDEVDLALSMSKKVVALPASGGTARRFHDRAKRDTRLRAWLTDDRFALLDRCTDAGQFTDDSGDALDSLAEEFTKIVEDLITDNQGVSSA